MRDVRAVQLLARVHAIDLPDEIDISVRISDPQYVLQDQRLLVRVTHTVDFSETTPSDGEPPAQNAKLATITVSHVADLELVGDTPILVRSMTCLGITRSS